MAHRRTAIIDIGSNSVRLVIYEHFGSASYRVIDSCKETLRLSEQIDETGRLTDHSIDQLTATLQQFVLLCQARHAVQIRAIATAAIREATNRGDVLAIIAAETGVQIDVLSGAAEARLGLLGTLYTLDEADGILVDIGGGSTEVTLFRNRQLVRSVSFPFGAVNTTQWYTDGGHMTPDNTAAIRTMVENALASEPWIANNPDLPLIGLGGTVRALCKIHQKWTGYSFHHIHGYELAPAHLDAMCAWIASIPVSERGAIDGLAADRIDTIVPGLLILHTLLLHTKSPRCIASGTGLRDGMFYDALFPEQEPLQNVLAHSVTNVLLQHPAVSFTHACHVTRFALQLYDVLQLEQVCQERTRLLLETAAMLHQIGVSVQWDDYEKHTFYMVIHAPLNGLSHREKVLCALIASYKNKGRTKRKVRAYLDLISSADLPMIARLGTIVQLASALDRSETQAIAEIACSVDSGALLLQAACAGDPSLEQREVKQVAQQFESEWGLAPLLALRSKAAEKDH